MKYFKYQPGDLVSMKNENENFQNIGRITEAIITFDGRSYNFWEKIPKIKNGYYEVEYSINPVRKKDYGKFKTAWWEENEILELLDRPIIK